MKGTTLFNLFLLAVAVAAPAWIAWRKAHKLPWLKTGLMALALSLLPSLLIIAFDIPRGLLGKMLMAPVLLGLSALGGALVYFLLRALIVGIKKLYQALRKHDWSVVDFKEEEEIDSIFPERENAPIFAGHVNARVKSPFAYDEGDIWEWGDTDPYGKIADPNGLNPYAEYEPPPWAK